MTTDRKTVVLATAVLLASWLGSSATSRPQTVASAPTAVTRGGASRDAAVDGLARQAEGEASRLRTRVTEAPAPRRLSRDPFRFGAAPAPQPRRQVRAALDATPELAYSPPPAAMPFKLIGIAENRTDDAATVDRKAILSGSGQLLIVGKDDSVGTRYVIVAVGADTVELFDSATGQPLRLALR